MGTGTRRGGTARVSAVVVLGAQFLGAFARGTPYSPPPPHTSTCASVQLIINTSIRSSRSYLALQGPASQSSCRRSPCRFCPTIHCFTCAGGRQLLAPAPWPANGAHVAVNFYGPMPAFPYTKTSVLTNLIAPLQDSGLTVRCFGLLHACAGTSGIQLVLWRWWGELRASKCTSVQAMLWLLPQPCHIAFKM